MKKVMFILAAIALAIGAQGAAITWKMGTAIKAPNDDGSIGSANAANGTLSMYVWLVNETTYNSATADSIVSDYKGKIGTADASVTGKGGAAGGQAQTTGLDFSTTQDTTYYGIVLTQYKSGDTEMWLANKASAVINTAGTDASVGNLSKNWGGGTGTAITSWSNGGGGGSDVPEPTSGLLLVLGGAMLALRRKQKK